jgi:hypothetical protein
MYLKKNIHVKKKKKKKKMENRGHCLDGKLK